LCKHSDIKVVHNVLKALSTVLLQDWQIVPNSPYFDKAGSTISVPAESRAPSDSADISKAESLNLEFWILDFLTWLRFCEAGNLKNYFE